MASFTASQTLPANTPELITDVDGIAVDMVICKIGDRKNTGYVVEGFSLAWNSRAHVIQLVVRKVGGTRRTKITGSDIALWARQ